VESLSFWGVFVGAVVALNVSPGPDMMYIVSRSLNQGRRVGVAAAIGVCSGALVHAVAAALGLSALFAASALAFTALKWVGAAYLVYLGLRAILSAGEAAAAPAARPPATAWQAWREGVLIDVLNPKVALFFIAFLPQFVRPGHGDPAWQILGLGLALVAVSVVVECTIALLAARAAGALSANRRLSAWVSRSLGAMLIGLGARLAFSGSKA